MFLVSKFEREIEICCCYKLWYSFIYKL